MWPLFFFLLIAVEGTDVTRDFFGDIFRMRDCHNGSRCDNGGKRPALEVPGRPCYCQCAPTHLAYRDDKQQCVKDIRECYMSIFYRPFTVEAIPLVYLPTGGQLVHPDAHLSLSGRRHSEAGFPKCKAAVSQYLTKDGWRTLIKSDSGGGPVFGLFTDVNKTFLQFLGNSNDRRTLQHHLALVRLFCKVPDYTPFETCVAIRVGWVPGVDSMDDTESTSSKANMMVVGLSLGVLGLVYVFAVLVYLKIRRQLLAKQKANIDQESKLQTRDDDAQKTTTLHRSDISNRLELYHTMSIGRKKKNSLRSNSHDPWSQMSPIVETYNRTWTDRMGCEFRAQDFKLQPEFFDPELMASPPQEILEYLERLQNSVTFARHRLRSCYRYQPTLIGIPEDDYFYQELDNQNSLKEIRTTPDGGSASSVGSLAEISAQQEPEKRNVPKVPPRKPKRKNKKNVEPQQDKRCSEQEQKDIQTAMNTLNDTLDALEFDICKRDIIQASELEQVHSNHHNSSSADIDDFDTSSCSSLSAVTVLGRETRKQTERTSPCCQSVERNLSEEFSTFSNSTYSLSEGMPGLFQHSRTASAMESSVIMDETCPSESETTDGESNEQGFYEVTKESTTSDPIPNTRDKRSLESHNTRIPGDIKNSFPNLNAKGNGENKTVSCFVENEKQTSKTKETGKVNEVYHDKEVKRYQDKEINSYINSHSNVQSTPKNDKNNINDKAPQDLQCNENSTINSPDVNQSNMCHAYNSQSFTPVDSLERNQLDKSFRRKHSLRKSSSTESLTTISTEMTTDSLDSRSCSPVPSPTPSLVDMWISKLVHTSVPYSKTRRKSKKKLVLPEDEVDNWEHVCHKYKNPCLTRDLNDSEPNLFDKLAHYGSKSMVGCDVAGYFQSLKQDVLKEHLKSWLGSGNQVMGHRGISVKYRSKETSHTKPLVDGSQDVNLFYENELDSLSPINPHFSNGVSPVLEDKVNNQLSASEYGDSLENGNHNINGNLNSGETTGIT